MKKIILSIFFIALSISLFAKETERIIVIDSRADTLVAPNEIDLMVTLQSDKGAGKDGLGMAEKTLADILKEAKIDIEKNFRVMDTYSAYNKKGNTVITYKRYNVTASNMEQVNVIMKKTTAASIGNVRTVKTYNTNTKKYIQILTEKALINAREEAKFQAAVLGAKVGKPIYINKGYSSSARPSNNMMMSNSVSNNESNTELSINIKDIELYVTIQVKFELL